MSKELSITTSEYKRVLEILEAIYECDTKLVVEGVATRESKRKITRLRRYARTKKVKIPIKRESANRYDRNECGIHRFREVRLSSAGEFRKRLDEMSAQKLLTQGVKTEKSIDYTKTPKEELREPVNSTMKARCYICRKVTEKLHHFYDSLCIKCADFNYSKRIQDIKLRGDEIAIVTGGRVKIGFQIALKLLRSNCKKVIVTSRFPNDTAARYALEKDYDSWSSNLKIYGLDFRNIVAVEKFATHVKEEYGRVDILINNAAQTIRRQPEYYQHLLKKEMNKGILYDTVAKYDMVTNGVVTCALSTAMSQIPLESSQKLITDSEKAKLFPKGEYDADGQQIDNSTVNSWHMYANEVSTMELLEVTFINSLAPFVLVSKLFPIMKRDKGVSFIINVSSMEGSFNRLGKTETHPHTNCAKAYMDMITRTSGSQYAKENIFMNSVDTGWVTNENPQPQNSSFSPPIDEIDGAMRVLDPIAQAYSTGVFHYGKYFKNYRESINVRE